MLTFNTVFISIMAVFQLILAFTNKDKSRNGMMPQIMLCVLTLIFAIFN